MVARPAMLVALLGACHGEPKLPAGDPATPDIVLVSIDTLRADHLSCYGHDRPTSPFIDGLAKRGVRFARARSAAPWTLPSHTTILTGQGLATHGVVEDTLSVDPGTPLLAEVLRARGYATGGFVATMYVSSLFGFDRGFDRFEDFGIHTEKRNLRGEVVAEDVVDEALDWWSDLPPGRPAFAFLHVYDVHYTYDPPEPYASMFDRPPRKGDPRYRNYFYFLKHPLTAEQFAHQRAQYDEAIRYVDDQLARLDAAIRKAGRRARWVVLADHGEEFGERGSWGHAHTLYPEQLDVPLVMAGPGIPEGRVVEGFVGTEDVAPTVAGWAEAPGLRPDGIDLAPAMAGQPLPDRAFYAATSRFATNRVGWLEDGYRLDWDLGTGIQELYDEREDPGETRDLLQRRGPPEAVYRRSPSPHERARRYADRVAAVAGRAWEARAAGLVEVPKGAAILKNGRGVRRVLRVKPGDRFRVVPEDAQVKFTGDGDGPSGIWAAAGGTPPGEGDPLAVIGASGAARVELDEATRAALEALGYMQSGEGP